MYVLVARSYLLYSVRNCITFLAVSRILKCMKRVYNVREWFLL